MSALQVITAIGSVLQTESTFFLYRRDSYTGKAVKLFSARYLILALVKRESR